MSIDTLKHTGIRYNKEASTITLLFEVDVPVTFNIGSVELPKDTEVSYNNTLVGDGHAI